jgi:hypothetical protein
MSQDDQTLEMIMIRAHHVKHLIHVMMNKSQQALTLEMKSIQMSQQVQTPVMKLPSTMTSKTEQNDPVIL